MFRMWLAVLATNPPSYNISLIRGICVLFFQKSSINDFKASLISLSFHGSLPLNVHNSFFVGSSNLSCLTMALLRVPLPIFNIFLVFLMSQAFFIWVLTIVDVSTRLVILLSLMRDLEPTFS